MSITLKPDGVLSAHEVVYPEPTPYLFKPLSEQTLVYSQPFTLTLDFAVRSADAVRARLSHGTPIAVVGALEYQACDHSVCYLPQSIPFEWTLRVTR